MDRPTLSAPDRDHLAQLGIDPTEADRQLGLLTAAPATAAVARPARVGDGIRQLHADEHLELLEHYDRSQRAGRWSRFVPASGAATRMFRGLVAFAQETRPSTRAELERRSLAGDGVASDVLRLLGALPRFPFAPQLEALLARRGERIADLLVADRVHDLVAAVLDAPPRGLGLASLPKALVPFHRSAGLGEPITALEEHLAEARALGRDDAGVTRVHFTVSPNHHSLFEQAAAAIADRLAGSRERFELGFSWQDPATDTLALDVGLGELARDSAGRPLLRPGGHGALIGNLARVGGDLVTIKNVDNVLPLERRELVIRWRKLLGGYLVRIEQEIHEYLRRLRGGPADPTTLSAIAHFLTEELSIEASVTGDAIRDSATFLELLDRPLRVCGVVENRGEPGGGPFWVSSTSGRATLQIVERAQIDESNAGAAAALAASTHFNPVDLSCSLHDETGTPYDLARFVDPDAAFVSTKSEAGRELRVLERPGLWNGAMAGWNTIFVEIPAATFAPVKSIFDLLRVEHQTP
jgi:hypothetical protein